MKVGRKCDAISPHCGGFCTELLLKSRFSGPIWPVRHQSPRLSSMAKKNPSVPVVAGVSVMPSW